MPAVAALATLGLFGPHGPLAAQIIHMRDPDGHDITRRCQPAAATKDLPVLSAVVDSTGVAGALAGFAAESSSPWLLSVVYARGAATPTVRWVEPPSGPDTVVRVVAAAAAPRPAGEPWAVRLRLMPGSPRRMVVEPALYCPPEPMVRGTARMMPFRVQLQPGDRMPRQNARMSMVAEVFVLETGFPSEVRLIQGSDIRELDDAFVRESQAMSFMPALLEGVPVSGWYRTDGLSPRPR
jgi:hypothetical protein